MKAAVYLVEGKTHEHHLTIMARGLRRHDVLVEFFNSDPAEDADFAVVWGWRLGSRIRSQTGKPVLVMERGYLGDRMNVWTSLGWDGLNGRARFNGIHQDDRFEKLFAPQMAPWQTNDGYALIVGQVNGDMALSNVEILQWYKDVATRLWKEGWDIKFRQHPQEIRAGAARPHVPFADHLAGSLREALSGAGLVVTYNSNTGVDAVMAGRPVFAADRGSMVYELASRDFKPSRPQRQARLNAIANVQWTIEEIQDGRAWAAVKEAMS